MSNNIENNGFTVFFTGLSGSGKSTLALDLSKKLKEISHKKISILDGDEIRRKISSELGFSKEHRRINIERISYIASLITEHGGISICAPIAPYDLDRKNARNEIEAVGKFVLVYLSTPLEICESRDVKGLYAKARSGQIQEFTGISDPYEIPDDAEIVIDTEKINPELSTLNIINYLKENQLI